VLRPLPPPPPLSRPLRTQKARTGGVRHCSDKKKTTHPPCRPPAARGTHAAAQPAVHAAALGRTPDGPAAPGLHHQNRWAARWSGAQVSGRRPLPSHWGGGPHDRCSRVGVPPDSPPKPGVLGFVLVKIQGGSFFFLQSSPLPSPPTEAGVKISRRPSSTPTTRRSSRPLARTASQAGPSSMTGSATSATSRQSSAVRIHACSVRCSTPAAEPGQSNALLRSGLQYRIVILTHKQGRCFLCVCCVLVRCCVWVWVFAVRECLGAYFYLEN